jgi:hypothetical protein
VFYIASPINNRISAGFRETGLDANSIRNVEKLLNIEGSNLIHKSLRLKHAESDYFYSLHAVYDVSSTRLLIKALFLHSTDNTIAAYNIEEIDEESLCDGCSIPTVSDGMEAVFDVINLFEIPGFLYPLIMLDTSTFEGKAISLITFTDKNLYSEYRLYEYVVNCYY